MKVQNSTLLVTGASSGLGAGCARWLAERAANLVLADLNQEAGDALARELGPRAVFLRTDVTDTDSVQAAIDTARQRFGELQGVIQCAGILGAARLVGKEGPHDLELFRRVVAVNLVGTFNVSRLAAAAMTSNTPNAEGERGVIVNTSSVAAFEGQVGQAAYSASKGGVASMTLPLARELARFGIRVVAIAPGVFETPMVSALPPEAQQSLAAQIPFPPRLGRASEFAALVQHIFENPMLNGSIIRLDGALRMAGK